jgi:hypothetical protein
MDDTSVSTGVGKEHRLCIRLSYKRMHLLTQHTATTKKEADGCNHINTDGRK